LHSFAKDSGIFPIAGKDKQIDCAAEISETKALKLSIEESHFVFGWNRVRQLAFGLFIKIRYLIKEQSSNRAPTLKIVSFSTSPQALTNPVVFLSTHKP